MPDFAKHEQVSVIVREGPSAAKSQNFGGDYRDLLPTLAWNRHRVLSLVVAKLRSGVWRRLPSRARRLGTTTTTMRTDSTARYEAMGESHSPDLTEESRSISTLRITSPSQTQAPV